MAEMAHSDSSEAKLPGPDLGAGFSKQKHDGITHPSGKESHGRSIQILRGVAFVVYFLLCCITYVSVQRLVSRL
jgi:hypothetical protein